MRSSSIAIAAALLAAGCTYDFNAFRQDGGGEPDAAGMDAHDQGVDAPHEASVDAAPDVSHEAGAEAGTDAEPEAGMDAGPEAGPEAGMDAAMDVAPDVAPDAPPDVTPPDTGGPDAPSSCGNGMPAPGAPAGTGCPNVRINELQSAGANGAADEFVELFNAGTCDVTLTNWTLRYASVSGTTVTTRWTGSSGNTIPAGGYLIVTGATSTCPGVPGLTGSTGVLAAGGGGIGLFDATGARVDSVGYGAATNPLVEGTPAAAPASGQSIHRLPDGHDTDVNSADFSLGTPTPNGPNG